VFDASLYSLVRSFEGKARSLPNRGAPERSFIQLGSGLTHKHSTRPERLERDAHSSLLGPFVNYVRKKFCNNGLWTKR
jgi:hypothetical protein